MFIKPWQGLTIVVLIIIIPLFAHLDDICMQIWDEARLANNAFEMYKSGDLIVTTFGYQPEMWNTKPPLLIWLQTLSLHVFGLNDLAIRIPTALSAFFTCIFLFWFGTRKLQKTWVGILAALVLVATPGYVMLHGVRTADYEGTLALFTTMFSIYYFLYLEENSKKYFWLFILMLICAVLTKGVAGMLFLPGLFIYTIYKKKAVVVLKSPMLYLGIVTFLFFVGGYYMLREHYNPGYWSAVVENELGGRFRQGKDGHAQEALHYFKYILTDGYKPWYLLFILGSILGFLSPSRYVKNVTVWVLITSLTMVLILSTSQTKLYWYSLPIFPLMAITVGIAIFTISEILYLAGWGTQYFSKKILPYLFIIVVCAGPFMSIVDYSMHPHGDSNKGNDIGNVMKKMVREGYSYGNHKFRIVCYDYQGGLDWYVKILQERNYPVDQYDVWGLEAGDFAIMYDNGTKKKMEDAYNTEIVTTQGSATIYKVHGRK